MHDHDDSVDHDPTGKVVTFNWMQPKHGGFLVIDDDGIPIKAFSTYFEMEHDCNMKMRQEAGIIAQDNERMPNIVSQEPPPNPKATHLTDEVHTQPSRWRLGQGIVDFAARTHR
jgi:hypothetical protein